MQEAFVDINGVPTHILTWGKWIEESLDDCKEIVICITGNPGTPGFYTKFLSSVYNNLEIESSDSCIPVWIIGHAGHDEPSSSSLKKIPSLEGNESLYNLDGQIQHKIEFIEKYVPKNCKIHLIGHSIGAWMVMQLFKNEQICKRIQKAYLLFPTIERMKVSFNGQMLTRILLPILFIVNIAIRFFNILPNILKVFLIYLYFWLFSIPNYFIGTTLKYLKSSVIEKVLFLAREEMNRIKELDVELLEKYKDFVKLYYGRTDGWVPMKYYYEIKQKIPDIDARLDNKNIAHAFVLRSSAEMANLVSDWIKENQYKP